jgi:hypothetical protein
MAFTDSGNGDVALAPLLNVIPIVDEWAVFHDGSIAIVRARDYHIDWVAFDGSITSSAAIPYSPRRLTAPDKVAFVDSVRTSLQARRALADPRGVIGSGSPQLEPLDTAGIRRLRVFHADLVTDVDEWASASGRRNPPPPLHFLPPEQLPDQLPPFWAGSVRADPEGNLWIRTQESSRGGLIYDIVDRSGALVSRVAVPAGRTVVGFGRENAVFLASEDRNGAHLERATFAHER